MKTAANSFLATKISFINAMAELCEATGADVKLLADAIGYDDRIGRKFLNAGLGFGGGCLPKDIRAFMARAGELGADQALTFLREVDDINMRRRIRMVELAREVCGGSLLGKRVAVLGRGVQARQRRHPRLPGAQRRRAAAAAGRRRARHRPGGAGERRQALCPQLDYARHRRRRADAGRRRPAADRVAGSTASWTRHAAKASWPRRGCSTAATPSTGEVAGRRLDLQGPGQALTR